MRKVYVLFYLLCILVNTASSFGQGINSKSVPLNRKTRQIDALVRNFQAYNLFNGSVLVTEKGRIIFQKGYGLANMEWNTPNSVDTKFRIGSITKQFTALLVLQLKQEGKLNLKSPITQYLPWYRQDTGNKITVHHLLTHASGIPNYTLSASVMNDIATHNYAPKEIAEKFCSGALEFEPGTKFSYNNSGYFLLGVIIEEITKKTFEQNLEERIFEPLGMKNSGLDKPSALLTKRAYGYEYKFNSFENSEFINMESATFAAGAIYSTVGDLNLWQNALFGDKLLLRENKNLMFRINLGNYGYGVFIGKFQPTGASKQITSIGHHGGIAGFSALLIRFEETETTVILLDNTRAEKRGNLENISLGIFQILNNLPVNKIRKSMQVAMIEKMRAGASGAEIAALYIKIKGEKNDYDLSGAEAFLNNLGYSLLLKNRVKDSLSILKLAVEEYPESANTFDTYGEALMKAGQREAAIKSYKRSLELNPQNENAVQNLKILSKPGL